MENTNGRKVFIVEDDQVIRQCLVQLLEMEGYSVECVSNGQEGLDALRAAEALPDVVVLDLMMPVKDGFAFREEQMADPRLAQIPVIVMSADGRLTEKLDRLRTQNYLRKPVDIDVFLRKVVDTLANTGI